MSAELALDLGKLKDRELRAIGEKVASRTRLSHSDAAYLFTTPDLLGMLPWYSLKHVKPKLNAAEQMRSVVKEWKESVEA